MIDPARPVPSSESASTRPPEERRILTMVRWLLYLVFAIIGFWVIERVATVITPILVAAGIAYLLDPWVDRLAKRMPRALAAAIPLVLFLGLLVGIAILVTPLIIEQVGNFVAALPAMVDRTALWVSDTFGYQLPEGWREYLKSDQVTSWLGEAAGPATDLAGAALGGLFGVLGFLAELLLIPVFAYYFLVDWDRLMLRLRRLVPPRNRGKVIALAHEINGVVSGWVRGQLIVTSILAVLYAIAFSIVGIHLAIPIGLVVGGLTLIPFVGTFVGAVIALGLTLLDGAGAEPLIAVGAIIVALHILEAGVLTPKIVGHKVGLSEAAALFAVVAGGKLLGFVGVLLAVPIAATIAVLLRHVVRMYESSELFGDERDAYVEPTPMTPGMAAVMFPAGLVPDAEFGGGAVLVANPDLSGFDPRGDDAATDDTRPEAPARAPSAREGALEVDDFFLAGDAPRQDAEQPADPPATDPPPRKDRTP